MPDLLIELFSEEIPARMQARARDDLRRMITDGLVNAGLTYAHAAALSTPRRLTLAVEGLTAHSAAVREERKGPATTAPQLAQILFVQAKLPAPSAATQTALGAGGAKVAVRENVGQSHFAIITPGNPAYTANEAAMLAVMTGGE